MIVLVTGCAGFIGSHLVEALCARGDSVIGVDNVNDYYDPSYKRENLQEISHSNFTFYEVDTRDADAMKAIFAKHNIDRICHLAAMAGIRNSMKQPHLYGDVNVQGTINILELAKEYGIENTVFASSSTVYGEREKVPFKETDNVDTPKSIYAATKRAGELLAFTYHQAYGLNISALRFFTVYGPRGRPDMAPYLFTKLIMDQSTLTRFGSGTSKRDYTFVGDIIQGVVAAIDKIHGFEVFNLGNSKMVILNDFIALIEELTGKKAIIEQQPIPPGDVLVTYADISKSKKMLGYNPTTNVQEGMKIFVDWYKQKRFTKSSFTSNALNTNGQSA